MDSNKKPVTGAEERLQMVISELDITIDFLLEKSMFLVLELQEMANKDISDEKGAIRFAYNQPRMYMVSAIAYDYLAQMQSALTSLIIQENREFVRKKIRRRKTDE